MDGDYFAGRWDLLLGGVGAVRLPATHFQQGAVVCFHKPHPSVSCSGALLDPSIEVGI